MIKWYSYVLAVLILIALILLIVSKFTILILLILALAVYFYVSLKSNEDVDEQPKQKENQKAGNFIKSLPRDNWYRVGDALVTNDNTRYGLAINKDGKLKKNEIAQYGHDNYPGSLLAYMVKEKETSTFLDSFNEYMSKVGPTEDSLKGVAVLHLRLGDKLTMNHQGSNAKFRLPDVESLNEMLFPFLKKNKIHELKIICGLGVPKKGNWLELSIEYLKKVLNEAEKQKLKTSLVTGSADEDLALLCKCPLAILTSGGYGMPSVAYRNKNFKTFVLINNSDKAEFLEKYLDPSNSLVVNLQS